MAGLAAKGGQLTGSNNGSISRVPCPEVRLGPFRCQTRRLTKLTVLTYRKPLAVILGPFTGSVISLNVSQFGP